MAVKDDAYWQERLDANRESMAKRQEIALAAYEQPRSSSRDACSEDGSHNSAG